MIVFLKKRTLAQPAVEEKKRPLPPNRRHRRRTSTLDGPDEAATTADRTAPVMQLRRPRTSAPEAARLPRRQIGRAPEMQPRRPHTRSALEEVTPRQGRLGWTHASGARARSRDAET